MTSHYRAIPAAEIANLLREPQETQDLGPVTEYLCQGHQDGTNGGWSHEPTIEKAREGAAWMLADGCDKVSIYPIHGDRSRDAHTIGNLIEVAY